MVGIENKITAYVDGSFSVVKNQYGWAYVIVENGIEIYSRYNKGNNAKYVSSNQIGGELVATLQAITYAINNEYTDVEIIYDYEGIEKWALGEWRAKSAIAQAYVHIFNGQKKKINVTFTKVKGHSGDKFNDKADILAKRGANL